MLVDRSDLGFTTDEPSYEIFFNSGPNAPLRDDLLERLAKSFVSDRRSPDVVRLVFVGPDKSFPLYLRVRLLQEVHLAAISYNDSEPKPEYDDVPELYFEAWIDQPEFDPSPTAPAIRCFIESALAENSIAEFAFDLGEMQFINKPLNFPF